MENKQATRNQSRAKRIKQVQQEEIRKRINAVRCLNTLERVAGEAETADSAQMPGLKLVADIQFRLLNKVLPDLKAVEHSGEGGGPLTVQIVRFADTDPE